MAVLGVSSSKIREWPTTMNNIPESEARELLATASVCEFEGEWMPEKVSPGTFTTSAGLVDAEGVGRQMTVKLFFRRSQKTGIVKYVFSVYKRTPYSLDRIYQLDVTHTRKPIKNLHDMSHEHIGSLRRNGNESWSRWKFEDVLEYFCIATNIKMSPGPDHPESFELRSCI